jgi:hypothetical protein
VNKTEYYTIKRIGNYRRGRHGSFKIIDNPVTKWLSINIHEFLIEYMKTLHQIPSPFWELIIGILLPVHIIIFVLLLYIEHILTCNAIIK